MTYEFSNNYIEHYETALGLIASNAYDVGAKHQAVLALARMGSLDFAVSEYARYGLGEIRNHEDIMALGGRLSKDLYLANSGKVALEHARDSAAKYEAAFQATKGFYSGVNAATMALMAGMPDEMIAARVDAILALLPQTSNLDPEDHYFVEATRAECFLLMGEGDKARLSLRGAIKFDPLNYAAHATTLKQFRLILKAKNQDAYWLKEFTPPRAVHFAGHIWDDKTTPLTSSGDDIATLLSDHIQAHDIGYGYGALAAGADIIFAESLLSDGAQLHVVLPCKSDAFLEQSVAPFGASWTARYKACMDGASSLTELEGAPLYSQADMQLLAGRVAMGQAIIKSRHFNNHAAQALLWDRRRTGSLTTHMAGQWQSANLDQIIVPLSGLSKNKPGKGSSSKPVAVHMMTASTSETISYGKLEDAIAEALKMIADDVSIKLALAFDFTASSGALSGLLAQSPAGSICVTEPVACCIVLSGIADVSVTFAGSILMSNHAALRCYTVSGTA